MCAIFSDGLTYQENLLTKYMAREGNEVYVIAPPIVYDKTGKKVEVDAPIKYKNEDGVIVLRLPYCNPTKVGKRFRKLKGFYKALDTIKPDIIFFHNLQSMDATKVKKYIDKNSNVRLYVDSHTDFSNSATNWVSRVIAHKLVWRHYAQVLNKHAEKFYGVLPARVEFLTDMYRTPKEKTELLIMGGDDDLIEHSQNPQAVNAVKRKYGISECDFLIVTGGKIDSAKKQTLLLMKAINGIEDSTIKLLIFGSIDPDIQMEANQYIDGKKIVYAGWLDAKSSYEHFAAADLVVFPGRHSVYWEQVVSQGIPMICKFWKGTTHVDIGGNVIFLREDSSDLIKNEVLGLVNNPSKYCAMKLAAQSEKRKEFFYSSIAMRSIIK